MSSKTPQKYTKADLNYNVPFRNRNKAKNTI